MSQHEDFLEGFGDALGIFEPGEIEMHYQLWKAREPMNEVELIDLEGGGYETGLEVGAEYRRTMAED